jgi:hypothetical protein
MKIFIRGHGGAFGRQELVDFVESGLRGPWYTGFRSQGEVASCQILRIMDVSGRRCEYHGLIHVKPSKVGWALIQKLNGKRMRGKAVQVRKWFERSKSHDRRSLGGLHTYPLDRERRGAQERRRMVRVQLLKDLPSALKGAERLRGHVA